MERFTIKFQQRNNLQIILLKNNRKIVHESKVERNELNHIRFFHNKSRNWYICILKVKYVFFKLKTID